MAEEGEFLEEGDEGEGEEVGEEGAEEAPLPGDGGEV